MGFKSSGRFSERRGRRIIGILCLLAVLTLLWPPAVPAEEKTAENGVGLYRLGEECFNRLDYHGAERNWQQALQIFRQLKLRKQEAWTLDRLAVLAAIPFGDHGAAAAYFEEALTIYRQLGLKENEAATLFNLGNEMEVLGEHDKAVSYYKGALQIYRQLRQKEEEARTLRELGVVAWRSGSYGQAHGYFEEALRIYRLLKVSEGDTDKLRFPVNLSEEEAITLRYLGFLAQDVGDYGKAVGHLEEALRICRQAELSRWEPGLLGSLGGVAKDLGDYDRAIRYFEEALKVYRQQNRQMFDEAAYTQYKLGEVYLDQGKSKEALEVFQEHRTPLQPRWLGKYYLAVREYGTAAKYFCQVIEKEAKGGSAEIRVGTLIALGLCAEGEGNWQEAMGYFREAVKAVEEERESIPASERGGFLSGKVFGFPRLEAYEGLVRVLHRLGQDEEAFLWSEHTKARELVEALAASSPKAKAGISQELRAKEVELANKTAAKGKQMEEVFPKGNKELYVRLEKELAALKEEQKELVARLYKEHPEYASIQYPRPLGAEELALKEDEVLIAYEVTDPLTLVFMVRGGKVEKVFEVKLTRKELAEKVKAYREGFAVETLDDLQKIDLELGHRLYRELLEEPLRAAGEGKVLIVPDEMLGLVPFEALVESLPDKARWEFEGEKPYPVGVTFTGQERVFGYWHSGTSLTVTRRLAKEALAEGPLLAVADPVFSQQDRRVQNGEIKLAVRGGAEEIRLRREITAAVTGHLGYAGFAELASTAEFVAALQKVWGRVRVLTGIEASETNLKKENLEKYAGVVLATHGIVDERVPYLRQPAIVLSHPDFTGEEDADGFLTASEIMGLKMRAEVVATLACLTGVGGIVGGEGVMHLGRAFQYAGAKSVLVSLWNVEDVSTNLFGEAFFAALKEGKDKDEALLLARQKLWEEGYRHPFYWSAFIVFGEGGYGREGGFRPGVGFSFWWVIAVPAALFVGLLVAFYLRKRALELVKR